ncbi:MAG: hypothetical protein SFW67_35640, partial [Myxococcaceae bacterium]|nr:hypothetical protein [Myxococcaceae bacterium]
DLDSERAGPAVRGSVQHPTDPALHQRLDRPDGTTACTLEELPSFLAHFEREHDNPWVWRTVTSRHLRGHRLEAFLAWLSSTGAP